MRLGNLIKELNIVEVVNIDNFDEEIKSIS